MLFSVSFAACQIDENGFVTGAACKIPKSQDVENTENQAVKQTKEIENNNSQKIKIKEKKKRINFKFDRSLLYRNVTIIWFN